MKTKIFSLLLAVAASIGTIFASDTQVDGIWYDFDTSTKTASVTFRGSYVSSYSNEYTGVIVIPASVTYNSVTYSVTSIGEEAFYGCRGLTSVTIGNSVTNIGEKAFMRCDGLTSVTIESDSIMSKAYLKNIFGSQVTEYIIGDEVTSIGSSAFSECSGLTSVTIGNSVTSIGEEAFYGCRGLTSVTIPNSVTSIGDQAFYGCSGLASVTIPNSVTSIGDYAFYGCSGLTSVTIESDSIMSKAYLENIFGSQVPEYIIGDEVTSIGDYAFHGCSGLTSVTIPNNVTSIGEYAFKECTGLTSIVWNAKNCPIPESEDGSVDIKDIPFYDIRENIESFTFGNEVEIIPFCLCYGMNQLTSVMIPNSVTSIGYDAFYGCRGLTSVTIPNSVTSIGEWAFDDCSSLTSVHISDIAAWCAISFATYDANPLSYAHNLYFNGELVTDLVIPEGVTSIGEYAFYGCTGLTSVTIPNSVTSIGGSAFENCTGLTSVTIPNSVTSIGDEAFSGCDGLTSVTIPNSVTSIGGFAFSGTGLTSVTIPNSVTSIGGYAFHYCTRLSSVTIEAETPPTLGEHPFYSNNCPIYVPCNAVNAYKTAWSEYADRIVANCSSFTITFVNWDGSYLQATSVTEGEMPQYTGSTPTRPDDEEYTYTFSVWTPAIVAATEDATYTANYTATPKSQGINDVQGDNVQCTKILHNGQIFILRGEKVYSLTGQEVK